MIEKLKSEWVDTPGHHSKVKHEFDDAVNADAELKELRDWVEVNVFGFGERCFYHMWKIIVSQELYGFDFLEIGVFRSQTLALIRLLSNRYEKNANITGITPLDSTDGVWESNYEEDIKTIHNEFKLEHPIILKGLSTDPEIIKKASEKKYDMIYIDGGHTYDVVKSDLKHYSPLVKVGGLLVMDDAAARMSMPFGFFQGIEDVTKATLEWHKENEDKFEFMFNVVHNVVYRRIK